MILYRARTVTSRPRRLQAYEGNAPAVRARGRWFTSDLAAAIAHRETLVGDTEILMVELPDAVAESYRVAVSPRTACGLSPGLHSRDPLSDHLIPLSFANAAIAVVVAGTDRVRDYIDLSGARRPEPVVVLPPAPVVLPLAA